MERWRKAFTESKTLNLNIKLHLSWRMGKPTKKLNNYLVFQQIHFQGFQAFEQGSATTESVKIDTYD